LIHALSLCINHLQRTRRFHHHFFYRLLLHCNLHRRMVYHLSPLCLNPTIFTLTLCYNAGYLNKPILNTKAQSDLPLGECLVLHVQRQADRFSRLRTLAPWQDADSSPPATGPPFLRFAHTPGCHLAPYRGRNYEPRQINNCNRGKVSEHTIIAVFGVVIREEITSQFLPNLCNSLRNSLLSAWLQ
jgi:hypothetical protein